MREINKRRDQRRLHAEARALGQPHAVVEFSERSLEGERDHAADRSGCTRDLEVVGAGGRLQRPPDPGDGRVRLEEGGDFRRAGIQTGNDLRGRADLRRKPGEVPRVHGLEITGDQSAEFVCIRAGGIDDHGAGDDVALVRSVFGETLGDDIGVRQQIDIERRADGGIEDDARAMPAGQCDHRRDVGCLDERIGRGLDHHAGNARTVGGEQSLQSGEIGDITMAQIISRRVRREFFQQGDAVEVEPAQLHPRGATPRRLQRADGAEGGVEGVHAARRQQNIGVARGVDGAQHALDFRGRVAGEKFFQGGRRQHAPPHEMVLSCARGEEAAGVLQVDLAAGVQLGRVGVRDASEAVDVKHGGVRGTGVTKVVGEGCGHVGRGDQPQRAAGEFGPREQLLAKLLGVRVHDKARVA